MMVIGPAAEQAELRVDPSSIQWKLECIEFILFIPHGAPRGMLRKQRLPERSDHHKALLEREAIRRLTPP